MSIRIIKLSVFLFLCLIVSQTSFANPSLKWDPSTGDVLGYKVYYGENSGSYANQMDVGNATECLLSDLTLRDNLQYYFSVKAYNSDGESDFSNEVSWKSGDSTPPITPQGFSVNVEPGQANLQWQLNSEDDLNGYYAYCGESSRMYAPPVPVGNTTICTLPNLEEGKQYYFAVSAYDTSGNESGFSNEIVKTIPTSPNQTPPPTEPPAGDPTNSDPVQSPEQWMDTKENNSMVEDGSLFKAFDLNGIQVFGTNSTHSNIHSHYIATGGETLSNYGYTGRMMISSSSGGIGVTIASQYPNRDAYYRLRRYGNNAFHIAPHGTKVSGDVDSGIVPNPNTWYRFKILCSDTGSRTEIKAKVWKEGTTEPDNWQIDAYDANASRLTHGTFGMWSYSDGSKYWDDINVFIIGEETEPPQEEDTISPAITITAPEDNYVAKSSPITLSGTASDNVGVSEISWSNSNGGNGIIGRDTSWNISNIPLKEGDNLITLKAFDAAGNMGSDTVRIWFNPLDTVAPQVTISSPNSQSPIETTESTIDLSGSASDNVSVQTVTWKNSAGGEGIATGTASWNIMNISLQEGENILTVTASDATGNSGSADILISKTSVTPPPANPVDYFNPTQYPEQWLDTAADNSMSENDSLFKTTDVDGSPAFGTTSTQTNIHSHYMGSGYQSLSNYEYTGRMRISSASGGTGVTILSQYPNRDAYYRLRRYGNQAFHISPHGTSVSGDTDSGVVPSANTWYRFRLKATDTGTRTEIKAKVWKDGSAEPSNWQIDAYDATAGRLTEGTLGVWAYSDGSKHWDDIALSGDGSQEPPPEEDSTPPTISITFPSDNFITEESQISLSGSAADNIGVADISWKNSTGGSGTITGASTWEIPNISLREGENLITVTAMDASGNQGTDTIKITSAPQDTIAPTITIMSPTNQPAYETQDNTITITGSASDNKAVQKVTWSSSNGSEGTASGTTAWGINDLQLQEGDNLIEIIAVDEAGNGGSDKITITYNKEATTPPSTISGIDPSQNSENWLDTAAKNSMDKNDSLFNIIDLDGDKVFGTTSTLTNIHSHNAASGSNELENYVYTGEMMITASRGGIGVTFLSQYPNRDAYYRLRRYGSESFRIEPHGVEVSGDTDTGIIPVPGTWYRYKVHVADTDNRTEIRANVWKDGTAEPSGWQVDAYDANANRLKQGTFGVWSYSSGSKYWKDISIMSLE